MLGTTLLTLIIPEDLHQQYMVPLWGCSFAGCGLHQAGKGK